MNRIKVKGKSSKGKDRVRQFGELWNIEEVRGNMMLILAVGDEDRRQSLRWMDIDNDKDLTMIA